MEPSEFCSQACAEAANPPEKCQKCGSEDFNLNGMAKCKGCGHTEFCEIVAGGAHNQRPKRKNAAPVHWTKRRRS